MPKLVRPIHAKVGDVVMIIWHGEREMLEERHTAPPPEVWKARVEQAKVMKALTQSGNPPDRIDT